MILMLLLKKRNNKRPELKVSTRPAQGIKWRWVMKRQNLWRTAPKASTGRLWLNHRSLEQWIPSSTLEQLFQMKLKTGGSLKDWTSYCSSDKAKAIRRDNNTSLGFKVKLVRSLVISVFLYACESWTLTAELEKRTQAFEMRCYRMLLNINKAAEDRTK